MDIKESEISQVKTPIVKDMILWWEKKRGIYNILIVLFSIFLMYSFWDYPMRSIVGGGKIIWNAVLFIFGANLFYTSGWALGAISHYMFDTKGLSRTGRWVLFVLGTLFSLVWTNFYFVMTFDVLFA